MATEAARAAEAILLVAEEPVEPQLLAQLLEVSPARVDELCAELAASYAGRGPGLRAGPGGRRLPLPDRSRPGALRRALRPRRPADPPVARRPGDARHRRLPASRCPAPQVASIRGVNADAVMRTLRPSRATSRRWAATPGRARPSSTAPPACSSRSWASTRSPGSRPCREFVPGARGGRRLRAQPGRRRQGRRVDPSDAEPVDR